MNEELVEVEGVAATTHELQTRYGALRLGLTELEHLAAAMVDGSGHFNTGHDPSSDWHATNVAAWIEEDGDYHVLKYRMTIPRSQYELFQSQAQELGVPGGFSVTWTEPVRQASGSVVGFVGDAADFTDEELQSLADLVDTDAPVSRLYQLEFAPEAIRFIIIAAASGLTWDLLKEGGKKLVARLADKAAASHRPVVLDVRLDQPDGDSELHRAATIHPDGDAAEALSALERLYAGEPPGKQ